MARIRSPNYPSISLSEALDRIAQVHERERQHPATREVIMKGMGFGGVNGASLGAISAALKYGLLERIGKSEDYRVSDRAVTILHPHSPQEKAEAVGTAARAPILFAELLDHFKGSLPSDDNLRAYLVRRGFSQTSLASVIQSFRETMELVEPFSSLYTGGEPKKDPDQLEPMEQQSGQNTPAKGAYRFTMAEGGAMEVTARLTNEEEVDKLIQSLTALKALF